MAGLRANLVSIVWLMLVTMAVGATVLYVFRTTGFHYGGWEGFDGEQFMMMWGQFLWLSNGWLVVSLTVFVLAAVYSSHAATTPVDMEAANATRPRRVASSAQQTPRMASLWSFLLAWTFCLAVTGPQLLLYMKTGMLNEGESEADFARYILPGIIGIAFVVAHMLRLIRWHGTGRLWHLHWLAVTLVGVSLFIRSVVAYREGREFAAYSRANDAWFESIDSNTNVDDPIVLVYLNSVDGQYATQAALRVYYILSQRHGRKNIYFCPIPPEPTLAQGVQAAERDDTRRHGKKMLPINQLSRSVNVNAVLMLNWGTVTNVPGAASEAIDQLLPQFRPTWFQTSDFRRESSAHGHISYFRQH